MTRRHLLFSAAAQTKRPKNVLVLMTDQHRPEALGAYGDPVARTPHLDRLAGQSVRFRSAYCTNPVCAPSRASLLTGLYTHHHRVTGNGTAWPFEVKTLAHAFARAGYMTSLVGKMHFVDAQTHGFEYRIDFNDWWQHLGPLAKVYADELAKPNSGSGLPQIDDLWRDLGDPWREVRENDGRQGLVHVGRVSKIPEAQHFDNFIAREAGRFLQNHGKRQPWLMVASFLKPHDPFMPAERFAREFRAEDMKLPATWGKVDLAKVPREIRNSIQRHAATPELADPVEAKKRIAFYYANLMQVDDCIGRVLRSLEEQGLAEDTIVVYTSDHGEMLGEHGLWQKFVFYEDSVRVPFTVRVPGVAAGECRNHVSLVDLFPTLTGLCGLPTPAGLDGSSLEPMLRAPRQALDRAVFAEFALGSPNAKWMVRRGNWKFNQYADMDELYDLAADPAEMRNLAPARPEIAGPLRQQLAAFKSR